MGAYACLFVRFSFVLFCFLFFILCLCLFLVANKCVSGFCFKSRLEEFFVAFAMVCHDFGTDYLFLHSPRNSIENKSDLVGFPS